MNTNYYRQLCSDIDQGKITPNHQLALSTMQDTMQQIQQLKKLFQTYLTQYDSVFSTTPTHPQAQAILLRKELVFDSIDADLDNCNDAFMCSGQVQGYDLLVEKIEHLLYTSSHKELAKAIAQVRVPLHYEREQVVTELEDRGLLLKKTGHLLKKDLQQADEKLIELFHKNPLDVILRYNSPSVLHNITTETTISLQQQSLSFLQQYLKKRAEQQASADLEQQSELCKIINYALYKKTIEIPQGISNMLAQELSVHEPQSVQIIAHTELDTITTAPKHKTPIPQSNTPDKKRRINPKRLESAYQAFFGELEKRYILPVADLDPLSKRFEEIIQRKIKESGSKYMFHYGDCPLQPDLLELAQQGYARLGDSTSVIKAYQKIKSATAAFERLVDTLRDKVDCASPAPDKKFSPRDGLSFLRTHRQIKILHEFLFKEPHGSQLSEIVHHEDIEHMLYELEQHVQKTFGLTFRKHTYTVGEPTFPLDEYIDSIETVANKQQIKLADLPGRIARKSIDMHTLHNNMTWNAYPLFSLTNPLARYKIMNNLIQTIDTTPEDKSVLEQICAALHKNWEEKNKAESQPIKS